MAQYVGILDGARDVWGVRIPDFPGCYGGGPTPEAAMSDAINALREVAAHYVANGRAVPAPRTMDEIRRDQAAAYDPSSESMVMVPLLLDKARPVRANISIDAGTLEAIDEEAEKRGLTRSSFLASAAIDKIGQTYRPRDDAKRSGGHQSQSSQVKSSPAGAWVKRDSASGAFMDQRTDRKPKQARGDRTATVRASDRKSKSQR
ncbi:MAG: type II toxin-antitoxin system HicB family antitoxin [Hyphomicrobiaceae bacterium]